MRDAPTEVPPRLPFPEPGDDPPMLTRGQRALAARAQKDIEES